MPERPTPWPHAPTHQLSQRGTYFLTAGTYLKRHHFRGADRLRVLQRGLLTVAGTFGWHLEAWAIFSNHYHFIGHSPETAPDAFRLSEMLKLSRGDLLNHSDRFLDALVQPDLLANNFAVGIQ